ncbi:MerR family transcriptional regulator [Microbacterium album]|uniref:MerR family transcriptional regulator n=1 Tax=Microbacterium album TaxID=2053191 RepID=A0A917IIX9_9MICO|nr:MerR family transcriptional regulator [Microbacterium album]GGH48794.1 MerR family transcriptional regulator [Microbacterium album]
MRISELSDRTGVSPASIKYYAREGLLPAGARTGYNSTEYDEAHVARLRLIRALIDTGGLTVAAAARVIAAIDDPDVPVDSVLGVAQRAVPREVASPSEDALEQVRAVMRERGWATVAGNPGIPLAAAVIDDFAKTGRTDVAELVSRYAAAVDLVAEADLDLVAGSGDRDRMAEAVVVGIALGDALLAGLRRIAQESLSHRRYRGGVVPTDRKEPA